MIDIPSITALVKQYQNAYYARVPLEKRMAVSKLKAEARAFCQAVSALYSFSKFILAQILPQTAEDEYLDFHTQTVGIIRKEASFASGTVSVTGELGSVIPANTLLTRSDGKEYETSVEITLTEQEEDEEQQTLAVVALEEGSELNCEAGDILTFAQPIAGVEESLEVISVSGGAEVESSSSLLARYQLYLQEPPHAGIEDDYVSWATSVTGITRAYVSAGEMGVGTVTIRVLNDGNDNCLATEQAQTDCLEYLETVRPITVKRIFVVTPTPKPITFQISDLSPDTEAVKTAIKAELSDLIFRKAEPNGTILISHVREAISSATQEEDHVLVSPLENITSDTNEIITFGDVEWL